MALQNSRIMPMCVPIPGSIKLTSVTLVLHAGESNSACYVTLPPIFS